MDCQICKDFKSLYTDQSISCLVEDKSSIIDKNDPQVKYLMAIHYENNKNIKKALELYSEASKQGYADASYKLGKYYEAVNIIKAVKYYQLASDQGNVDALFDLAVLYENGAGVHKDIKKAIELYTLAANKGCVHAQYNLALCYENGKGVKKNIGKAMELYTLAAAQGDEDAQHNLNLCNKLLEEEMEKTRKANRIAHLKLVGLYESPVQINRRRDRR